MYLVTSAGIILLGFGGAQWTKEYAFAYFRYLFAIAVKLFIIQLLVGLCEGFVMEWLEDIDNEDAQITIMIGASFVLLSLVKQIPQLAASLLQDANISFDHRSNDTQGSAEKMSTRLMADINHKVTSSVRSAVQFVADTIKVTPPMMVNQNQQQVNAIKENHNSFSGQFSHYKNSQYRPTRG